MSSLGVINQHKNHADDKRDPTDARPYGEDEVTKEEGTDASRPIAG